MAEIDGRPATDVLGEIDNGQYLHDITAALYDITRAVLDVRKPGTLTLTLKLTPTGRGSVEIDAKLDAKIPLHDRSSTTFFATPDGTLMRDDPKQERLPLREVRDDEQPLRTRTGNRE